MKTFRTGVALAFLGVVAWPPIGRAAEAPRPRLVVVVSVDQLAAEYLERFSSGFSDKGIFRRCASHGAWFTNCHHAHAFTYTAPGHAVQLTGCYAPTHGIIDNDWFDRQRGKLVYCLFDPQAKLVGTTIEDLPVSPRSLLADTLGDRLKMVTGRRSKVFTVAIKDRAAILLGGHMADAAFWMSNDGKWITSDYYRGDLPGYLRQFNESGAIRAYAGRAWKPLLEPAKYLHGPVEDSFGERPLYGMTKDFPHVLARADNKYYVRQLAASPLGNELTLAVARDILVNEKLGQDEFPDLLGINLTSNDYVGHMHGPYSLEVEDITYRTDLVLGEFFDFVNAQLKGEPWIMVITADHGIAPIPEWAEKHKLKAGRNPLGKVESKTGLIQPAMNRLEAHLRAALRIDPAKITAPAAEPKSTTEPKSSAAPRQTDEPRSTMESRLVSAVIADQVYLNLEHPALAGQRAIAAQRIVRDWLLDQEGVASALTREQLLSGGVATELEQAMRRSFHPRRSGDVLFALQPYYFHGEAGTTHGSPYYYDTHVPLLMLHSDADRPAPTGIRPGRFDRRVSPAAIAPTLARLLGIDPPGGCVEEPLREVLSK